jgi:hypothetical protein
VHARAVCPGCATYVKKDPVVVRGTVKAKRVFQTEGQVVCVVHQDGQLRYLYQLGDHYYREPTPSSQAPREVVRGRLRPDLRYRISGEKTFIGREGRVAAFPGFGLTDVDSYGRLALFDVNARHEYWIAPEGQLFGTYDHPRHGRGNRRIGDVLQGRTLFWVGERFGFGFYRAGSLVRAFVFSNKDFNDRVEIEGFRGELVDSTCAFSDYCCWFFATLQENGRLRNHVYVIDVRGNVLASRSVEQTADDWLASGIRGRFAAGQSLYVPTHEGIVRVDREDLSQPGKTFPDTQPFVDELSYLLAGDGGIYVVGTNEITLLTMQ